MKNIIITLVTIAAGFGITYYVLDNVFVTKNITPSTVATSNNISSNTSDEDNDGDYNDDESQNQVDNEMFPENLSTHLSSVDNWNSYFEDNVDLSSSFIALDTSGEEIDKGDFLSELTSGQYAPIKLLTGEEMYQLYKLSDSQNLIGNTIQETAKITHSYYLKEGTKLAEFDFVDLNGTKFSSENTQGKIIIMKCWYIDNEASIEEFKELNKLYDEYEAYEDVMFLSLAFDQPSRLKTFLTENEFRYPVIANQKNFIENKIETSHFPTHLIIDEEGYIEKMASSVDELKDALEKMSAPDISDEMDQ
ncbi:TlpA disulfide reductase family protein [uncultured Tenacibaculum sp.]|uniref:TlpA family protein disulfide reductase n=1 Tax=uncultured Tenacibaculum sp. TaxID=174713 RepID=UPI00260D5062|nr:TlpA disulfide reductase family protein [uncultured Tenacibaculum sp.]